MLHALIIDSLPLFAHAVHTILTQSGFATVATAASVGEAVCLASTHHVDLVLAEVTVDTDLSPLRDEVPHAVVVGIAGDLDEERMRRSLASGARGVLSRMIEPSALVSRLYDAMVGLPVFDQHTGPLLFRSFRVGREGAMPVLTGCGPLETIVQSAVPLRPCQGAPLSQREREVLDLYDTGLSTAAIGAKLCLSPATVKTHVSRAMAKTGTASRSELLAYRRGVDLRVDGTLR